MNYDIEMNLLKTYDDKTGVFVSPIKNYNGRLSEWNNVVYTNDINLSNIDVISEHKNVLIFFSNVSKELLKELCEVCETVSLIHTATSKNIQLVSDFSRVDNFTSVLVNSDLDSYLNSIFHLL